MDPDAAAWHGSYEAGRTSRGAGRLDEAEGHLRAAMSHLQKLGARDARLAATACELGHVLLGLDRARESEPLFTRAIGLLGRQPAGALAASAAARIGLALAYVAQGGPEGAKDDLAQPLLDEALKALHGAGPGHDPDRVLGLAASAQLAGRRKAWDRAAEAAAEALALREGVPGDGEPTLPALLELAGRAALGLSRAGEAAARFRRALDLLSRAGAGDAAGDAASHALAAGTVRCRLGLAEALHGREAAGELAVLVEASALAANTLESSAPGLAAQAHHRLGVARLERGDAHAACEALERALACGARCASPDQKRVMADLKKALGAAGLEVPAALDPTLPTGRNLLRYWRRTANGAPLVLFRAPDGRGPVLLEWSEHALLDGDGGTLERSGRLTLGGRPFAVSERVSCSSTGHAGTTTAEWQGGPAEVFGCTDLVRLLLAGVAAVPTPAAEAADSSGAWALELRATESSEVFTTPAHDRVVISVRLEPASMQAAVTVTRHVDTSD